MRLAYFYNWITKTTLWLLFSLILFLFSLTPVLAETRTKTVQFYIGQDTASAGVAAGVTWPVNFSVYLPDAITSSTAIKSAYIDYTFNMATTTAAGVVTLGLKLTSEGTYTTATSVSYTSSAESHTIRYRADFLSHLQSAIQSSGTYNFNFYSKVAGTAYKASNAKIIITYDYDHLATTQIRTARFYGGMIGTTLTVGTSTTFTLSQPGLPENSVSIYDAWADISAYTVNVGTTDNQIQVQYDSDALTSYYIDSAGGAGSQNIRLLHRKVITDASHTLSVKATAGYPLGMVAFEQYITYSFNYTNSTSLLNSLELLLLANGSLGSTATLTTGTTFSLPESSVSWKSIYLEASAHSGADSTTQVSAKIGSTASSFTNSYRYDWNGETLGNFRVLSNETNNLNTMSTGNNDIYFAWKMSAGNSSSRFASVILTYSHAKSDTTLNNSLHFLAANGNVYSTGFTSPFNVSISGNTSNYRSFLKVGAVAGATTNGALGIAVLPSSTLAFGYNTTGEYLWVEFARSNTNAEITGTGSYTANLYSNQSVVKYAHAVVSFQYTANSPPTAPTSLLVEGQSSPALGLSDTTPEFSAVYNDPDTSDVANKYQLQVDDNSDYASPYWDSGSSGTSMTNCSQGARCADISYSGSNLAVGTTYYWRIKYWDTVGDTSPWSSGTPSFSVAAATIDVSGTCHDSPAQTNTCTDTGTLRVAVNGSLQAQTQTTVGENWTISGVPEPSTNQVITVFIDGAADDREAVAITKYDGSGNITGIKLYEQYLTLGSDDQRTGANAITNANISSYDYSASSNDEDIFFDVDANNDLSACVVGVCYRYGVHLLASNEYRPDSASSGNVSVHNLSIAGTLTADGNSFYTTGSWVNSGVFTANSSNVYLRPVGAAVTLASNNNAFNNLTLGDSLSAASYNLSAGLTVSGDLNILHGVLNQTSSSYPLNLAGDLTINDSTQKFWTRFDDPVLIGCGLAESTDNGCILTIGSNTTWDDYLALSPTVIKDGSTYKMWYSGYDGTNYRIGYATSDDGYTWTKNSGDNCGTSGDGCIFGLSASGNWDDDRVWQPTVIKDGSTYKMWYSGHDGTNHRIGYATSSDGITWTRYTGNNCPGTTGNGCIIPLGSSGTWDDFNLYHPSVILDGSTYKMWYSGHDSTYHRIGYATSSDGISWTRNSGNNCSGFTGDGCIFDIGVVGAWDRNNVHYPSVIKNNDIYHLFYTGVDSTNNRLGYATSSDGVTFTRFDNPSNIGCNLSNESYDDGCIIGVTGGSNFDSTNTSYAGSLYENGSIKVFYSGHNGTNYRIGYAVFAPGSYSKASGGEFIYNGSVGATWTDNSDDPQDLGVVKISGTSKTVSLATSAKATSLDINSGQTLNLSNIGNTLTFTGATGTILTKTGNFTAGTSTVKFLPSLGSGTTLISAPLTFNNLSIGASSGSALIGESMVVSGDLSLTAGTLITTDISRLDINGNMTVGAGSTFIAPASVGTTVFTLAGNFTNNGTYTHSSGRLTFDGGAQSLNNSATTTFYQWYATGSVGRTMTFAGNTHWAVGTGGALTFTGAASNLLALVSSDTNSWFLEVSPTSTTLNVDYVRPSRSNATDYKTIVATNSEDGLNNLNWSFGTNSAPSAPATLYANNTTAQSGQTSPVYKLTDFTPAFSAVFDDPDTSDTASAYELEVGTNTDWASAEMWDSGKQSLTPFSENTRSADIIYGNVGTTSPLLEGSTYYWRLRFWDNSDVAGTWSTDQIFTINNFPSLSSITVNSGQNVNLTAGSTTPVVWSSTVTDLDGNSDLSSAVGVLYRSGVASGHDCTTSEASCYRPACALNSCSGNTCTAACTAQLQFFADPTDVGTYSAQYWRGFISAVDLQGVGSSAFSAVGATDVMSLLAINTGDTIAYGQLLIGDSVSNKTTGIYNLGNSPLDFDLYGTNLCSDFPSCAAYTISVTKQQHQTTTFTYGTGTTLNTVAYLVNTNLSKSTVSPSNSSQNLYWGIEIPPSTQIGTYQGQVVVEAVAH